jgi:hypothetical protein
MKSNRLLILQFVIAIISLELFIYLCAGVNFTQDDTYISLQYAKNLASGNGLVFNIGERVEGFTSLLWVLLLSISYLINVDPISYAKFLSIGFGYLTIISTYYFTKLLLRRLTADSSPFSELNIFLLSLIPSCLLLFSGTYYYWSVSGMGTTLFTFLVTMGLYFLIRELPDGKISLRSAILFGIACLTRPEGIYIVSLVLLMIFISYWIKPELNLKNAIISTYKLFGLKFLLIIILPNLLLLIFRLAYFGYPLPNTFYAKTGFHLAQLYNGLKYFYAFIKSYMLFGTLFILPVFLLFSNRLGRERLLLYGLTICYTLYIIFVGGDVLILHRFFLPIMPSLYVLIFLVVIDLVFIMNSRLGLKKYSSVFVMVFFTLVIFINYNYNADYARKRASRQNGLIYTMMDVGKWMSEYSSRKNVKLTIAASTIGALKYYANSRVIDMMGLTDSYITHNPEYIGAISDRWLAGNERKYNTSYILKNKPDFIVFSTKEKPSLYCERAIFTREEFMKNYYIYPIQRDTAVPPYNVHRLKTRDDFEKVVSLEQTNENYNDEFVNRYSYLCNIRGKQHNTEKWEKFFTVGQDLINISPSYFNDHLRMLAWGYYKNNELDKAIELAQKSLQNDLLNIYSRILLYKIYMDEGNEDSAGEQWDEIKRLAPDLIYNDILLN